MKTREHREKISRNESVKSSDTSTDVGNRIFVMGDSIVKHVRGYGLHVKWKTAKLRAFWW